MGETPFAFKSAKDRGLGEGKQEFSFPHFSIIFTSFEPLIFEQADTGAAFLRFHQIRAFLIRIDILIRIDFDSYCFCHSLFILCPIVYFRRARGANVRENHKRAGKSSLRSGLPLPLKVPSHTLLPYYPPSLGFAPAGTEPDRHKNSPHRLASVRAQYSESITRGNRKLRLTFSACLRNSLSNLSAPHRYNRQASSHCT